MRSREVIDILTDHGWFFVRQVGSHRHYRHPTQKGLVTVPHPSSEMTVATLKSIERQSGVKLRS